MAMTRVDYAHQLRQLLPPSEELDFRDGSNLSALLSALAGEPALIDALIEALAEEADPRTTYALLSDWERVTGLPDPCAPAARTLAERRDALLARLTGRGGQSRQYYIDQAASLGYTITIEEFRPHNVTMGVNAPIAGSDWAYAFRVHAPASTVRTLTVKSGVNEPLRSWGVEALECSINSDKPAHTTALFSYESQ
ncbi:MAG: DUF2313 domain-containing protein [Gammaproteobacteria bacterium]|nr:MAG: DUF2313 domain-containing protein [Gammaproteobacteria bacterium]